VYVSGKVLGIVEAPGAQVAPGFCLEDLRIYLALPQDLERLALSVVVDAGQPNKGRVAGLRRGNRLLDEVSPLA
jgi:hypothetical protein